MANCDNPSNGANFEKIAQSIFKKQGISLRQNFALNVGIGDLKKAHAFDLGADEPQIIVECKRHCWTEGKNVPSAKMATWNEAMYYFSIAPMDYRKILFVLRDMRRTESLGEYYTRTYEHLIPIGVEILEYDHLSLKETTIYPRVR